MSSWRRWRRSWPERLGASRNALVILALAISWLAPAPVVAQDACGDFAVAVAPQPPGHPLSDNAITLLTSAGEPTEGTFEEPRTVEPSPKAGVALVRSLGGIFGLMDVFSGDIMPLQIPENAQRTLTTSYPTVRNAPESNFMLLSNIPGAVWLVDLTNGDAIDLTELGKGGTQFIESAEISPDGSWLIYFSQDAGFLISLKAPGEPMPIEAEPLLPFPSFDANSNVVYAVRGGLLVSIRSLDPDTGNRTELAATAGVSVLPLRLGPSLLYFDGMNLRKLEQAMTTPTTIFEWVDGPGAVLSNEAGTYLLISDNRDDVTQWFWINVATGTNVELLELDDMIPVPSSAGSDTVLFAPSERIGEGVPGAPYRTVNLSTGSVATPLEQDSTDVYQARAAGDAAGRYSIVNAVRPGYGRIWLIDNLEGTAELVGTSTGNVDARVSPDGCQIAVAVYDTVGEGRTSTVTMTSLVDGSTSSTVPDALLLGWAAIAA